MFPIGLLSVCSFLFFEALLLVLGRFRYNDFTLRPLTYPMILPGRFIVIIAR